MQSEVSSTAVSSQPIYPSHSFVVKVVEQCNIRCDYCYMYEFDRDISKTLPRRMSSDTFRVLLDRIVEHVDAGCAPTASISFHGGEPLLLGVDRLGQFAAMARTVLGVRPLSLTLQTNATLINEVWLELFVQHGIQFGFSLDGPPALNDRHRRTVQNNGTAAAVEAAIGLVQSDPAASSLFQGVLAVIPQHANGAEVVQYFLSLGLTSFDFLLPDRTFGQSNSDECAPWVAEFLIQAFDEWFHRDDPSIHIRLFRQILLGLMGKPPSLDVLGRIDGGVAIVETDGGILPHDVLRLCGPPLDRALLNIHHHPISLMMDPGLYPWRTLSGKCKSCSVQAVCGGGHPVHRFDGRSFNNPSAYCSDMIRLIRHIAQALQRKLSREDAARYPALQSALMSTGAGH